MSKHSEDEIALTLRISEQLAVARTEVARLRPQDKALRGRLRQQLDGMLMELLAPGYPQRGAVDTLSTRSLVPATPTAPAARPLLSLRTTKQS